MMFSYETIVMWNGIIGRYGILYDCAKNGDVIVLASREERDKYMAAPTLNKPLKKRGKG